MSTETWRLIPYSENDAATNMAIDEAILEAHASGEVPTTIRLYGFKPSAVSIGLSQKLPPEAEQRILQRGMDIVRRPTGGRAVLHHKDLTYSFVGASVSAAPELNGFLSDGVTESYSEICAGLIEAFASMGIQSELGAAGSPYRHLQDCFGATTSCDLQHQGIKLIGSAQVRRRGIVLQHGSAPLDQDLALMAELLDEPNTAPDSVPRHTNIFALLQREVAMTEFETSFAEGFAKAFSVTVERSKLTGGELARAADIRQRRAIEFPPPKLAPLLNS